MSSPTLPRHRSAGRVSSRTAPLPAGHALPPPGQPAASPEALRPAALPAGRYRYDPVHAAWWWSPEMYLVHGMPSGSVQPCIEQLLQRQHPDDRARTRAAFTRACENGQPFCLEVRIVCEGGPRTVVVLGEPDLDASGSVTGVSGLVADVTDGRPEDGDRTNSLLTEIAQLRTAMASRAAIEQAKGILMLLTGCGDQVAFELLAHISSHTHRKVRDVAQAITESASGRGNLPDDVRAILRDACPPGKPMH